MRFAPTNLAYSIAPSAPSSAHLVKKFENPPLSPCPEAPSVWPRGLEGVYLGYQGLLARTLLPWLLLGLSGVVELDSLREHLPSPIDLSSHHALYTHFAT